MIPYVYCVSVKIAPHNNAVNIVFSLSVLGHPRQACEGPHHVQL